MTLKSIANYIAIISSFSIKHSTENTDELEIWNRIYHRYGSIENVAINRKNTVLAMGSSSICESCSGCVPTLCTLGFRVCDFIK